MTKPPTRIEGNIPVDLTVENFEKFLFISFDQGKLTHGLHKYPAKFFPELPRWLISRYSVAGETILDPFMGSGTVNVEASLLDRPSIGVDVDPFSRYLSRVKTTPLPVEELHAAYLTLRDTVRAPQTSYNGIPEFPYRDKWFQPEILRELATLKHRIDTLETSPQIKDFFLVCFSSIIRAVSEADNHCTRTVIRKVLKKVVESGDAVRLFLRKLERQVPSMMAYSCAGRHALVRIPEDQDARRLDGLEEGSIGLAVTSPPYANAVDYPRTHQLEMYWLGLASGSLTDLKRVHVGTEAVLSKDYAILHQTGYSRADEVIRELYGVDRRRAYIGYKYLRDMEENLREVYRVLRIGGRYVIVVGTNMMRGRRFETWEYLREMGEGIGYEVELVCVSGIIRHFIKVVRRERITDDYILVLRK